MQLQALVIIPTYNEKANIAEMIRKVLGLGSTYHLLIVDDNSPDGTADVVEESRAQWPQNLHMIRRPQKGGLGKAYLAGFAWALDGQYDYVIEMDADFSHNPADLPRLIRACEEGADVAIGSRYTRHGKVENWPQGRILLSRGASWYVRCITWLPVRDPTAGFVCYRMDVLRKIDLGKIKSIGYAFQIEMKFAAWKSGFTIREIPITFKDREKGVSKMTTGIFKEAFWGVIRMQWKSLRHNYLRNPEP